MEEITHHGTLRGGGNAYARLHLHILIPGEKIPSRDEMAALFAPWDEAYGITGSIWIGWDYRINTRREFAIVPAIIRKAIASGYDVALSQWDVGIKDQVSLSADPVRFWREVALSQMWFEK